MPVIASRFSAPWWVRNGHTQTILPALVTRAIPGAFSRERIELEDGDFLDLDWLRGGNSRLAILTHGLEGSSRADYIRGCAGRLAAAGWDVLAWNFRGCSGEPNRLLRYYHAGDTGDLARLIERGAKEYPRIALIGFSLGGNVTLKYMGEAPPHASVHAAVAISAAVDLEACVRRLDQRADNWLYRQRFLATLFAKIEQKARQFPGQLDLVGMRRIRGIEAYDDRYAAPIHGFRGASDYYARSSSRQFLRSISIPTLILSARNDPFLPSECFPESDAEANPNLFLEAPESGGHVGFLDLDRGVVPWSEWRALEFLEEVW
jgi:predicted alpha/beta-fold hydrolase